MRRSICSNPKPRFQPWDSIWPPPGRCIDEHCFESDSDAVADLIVFTSVPIVWQRFKAVLSATINSNTGKQYGLSTLPNMDWVETPSPTLPAAVCAECFVCKVRSARLSDPPARAADAASRLRRCPRCGWSRCSS